MLFARHALLESQWATDVRIDVDQGRINSIEIASRAQPGDTLVDTLLPAIANLHSHAFQRAMAGRTETRTEGRDSFWSWRELMYRFVDRITPEQVEAIAAYAYMQMLEAGYGSVGEFHYLHHQKGGIAFGDLSETSKRIFAAAQQTGIGLTHLPVLYSYAGVDKSPLQAGQLRFGNDSDRFDRLVEEAGKNLPHGDSAIGVAPHSLRAVGHEQLSRLSEQYSTGPIHIHVAEQVKEVEEIEHAFGARPIEYLLSNFPVAENWCLIHATHMDERETEKLAKSGAVAGLCPITEANLGDGVFNGADYLMNNGVFGIGTDSNISISLVDELRMLEYSQRLVQQQRNVLAMPSSDNPTSVGQYIYCQSAQGGAQALARDCGSIKVGNLADLVAIDSQTADLCTLPQEQLLDGWIFASNSQAITDVWSAGRHNVKDGRHVERESITKRYVTSMHSLLSED